MNISGSTRTQLLLPQLVVPSLILFFHLISLSLSLPDSGQGYSGSFTLSASRSLILNVLGHDLPGAMTTTAEKRPISWSVSLKLFIRSAKSNMESMRKRALLAECSDSGRSTSPFRQIMELVVESNMHASRTSRTSKTPACVWKKKRHVSKHGTDDDDDDTDLEQCDLVIL